MRVEVSPGTLWFGIFGAPAAWSLQLLASYPLAAHACYPATEPVPAPTVPGLRLWLALITIVTVGLAALALALVLRARRRLRRPGPDTEGPERAALDRMAFMTRAGLISSTVFLTVALFHGASLLVVGPCW